jgi:NAD(P)H-dependent FMN reductase
MDVNEYKRLSNIILSIPYYTYILTGIFGGMRAAMQLRPMLSELGTLSVSNIFGIPKVQNSFDEEGNPTDDHMVSGAKKLLDQLDWYAVAMKNHRDTVGVPQ